MLLVSPEVRAAFVARRRRDPRAAVAVESAAALHVGAPPALPLRIATAREVALRDPYLTAVAALGPGAKTCEHEGLRLTTLEQTVIDLLSRPSTSGSVALATALLTTPSAAEARPLDLRLLLRLSAAHPQASTRRRVAFLLARAGLGSAAPSGRAAVPLDPVGRLRAPAFEGVRLNTADGLPDPTGRIAGALSTAARALDPRAFDALAWLVRAGIPLDPPTLTHAHPRLPALAAVLERHGLLRVEAGTWLPIPPFDPAAAPCAPALGADLARKLTASAPTDTVLLHAALGQGAEARRLLVAAPLVGDPVRAARLLALTADAPMLADVRIGLLERLGRWAEIRSELLDRLRLLRGAGRRAPLLLALARACWRLGRGEECRTHLRALGRHTPSAGIRRERSLLEATLAIEAGRHGAAAATLRELVRSAERTGDDRVRARAHHRLGALSARQGRFVEAAAHYRAALEAGTDDPTFEGLLRSNLAATALWSGRWDEAEREGRTALALRLRHGTGAEALTTRVLLARLDRARDRPVPPEGRFARLAVDADAVGDVRLRVEVWLDLAEERVRGEDVRGAQGALERAHAALAGLGGGEPVLTAMVTHVEGLVLTRDAPTTAFERLAAAVAAHERQAGGFWAARAARDAASLCEETGRVGEALEWSERSLAACARGGFELGEAWTHLALTVRGALVGSGAVRASGDAALRALGTTRVVTELLRRGRDDLAEALRQRPSSRPTARDRARLLQGVPGTLVLDLAGDLLVRPDGVRVPLGRRRVLGPLLRAFASRAGELVPAPTLIREVWETRDGPSARASLKMSVSRLRDLLGPYAGAVAVGHRRGELSYGLADLALVVLGEM